VKTRRNAILTAISAVAIVLVGAGVAEATWLSSGSGSGTAKADQLKAASAGNGSTATSSSITIAVTAAPTGGATPTSYRVDRTSTAAPGVATGVCTITASSGTGSCTDSGLNANTAYTYAVYSQLGTSWVSSGSLAVSGTTSAPAVTVSTPVLLAADDSGTSNSDHYTNVQTPHFTGTATAGATVKILEGSTVIGTGTATSGTYNIQVSSLTGGAGTVHTISASATVLSTTVNSAGSVSVTIDTVAPSGLTVSCSFGTGSNYTCSGAAGNAANDASSVILTIKQGTSTVAGPTTVTRTGATWTSGSSGLNNNTNYTGNITQSDLAGNTSSATSSTFSR